MALVGGCLMLGSFFVAFLVDCLTEMRDALRKLADR